ncbi:MAG TPA: NAD(P)/FAD-dependent oxidoreductase, partial [Ktedonobacteraceae bacterium]
MGENTTQNQTVQATTSRENQSPTVPHIVIVGGGFGGLQAARALEKQAARITVIDRHNFHLFQPMLYQVASAGLSSSDISTSLRSILHKQQNTDILMAQVIGIDLHNQHILMDDDQTLHYDYLILATGATSNYFGHPEWASLAPGMKTLEDALAVRRVIFTAFEAANRTSDPERKKALLTFVLVGGGPTGVELAGAIAELAHETLKGDFQHINLDDTCIVLVQGSKYLLPGFPVTLAKKTQKRLQELGVKVITGVHVQQMQKGYVQVGDESIETENVIWTAGVKASPVGSWLQADVDHAGRVRVQSDLTVPEYSNIFVIGDTALATQDGKTLPGIAPVAMQEGQYVASTIADRIAGKASRRPFRYFDKGMLATVGRSFAVVDIGPLHFTGFFAWIVWLVVHIFFLISFRNRIMVLFQYAWCYFTFQ